jgi:hypothetical protein
VPNTKAGPETSGSSVNPVYDALKNALVGLRPEGPSQSIGLTPAKPKTEKKGALKRPEAPVVIVTPHSTSAFAQEVRTAVAQSAAEAQERRTQRPARTPINFANIRTIVDGITLRSQDSASGRSETDE